MARSEPSVSSSPRSRILKWSVVAVAILSLVCAVLFQIGRFFEGRHRQVITVVLMQGARLVIGQHQQQTGESPSVEEIVNRLGPNTPFRDGWENALIYSRNGGYVLIAPGRDGKADRSPHEYRELAERMKSDPDFRRFDSRGDFDADMVIVDGDWLIAGGKH